MFFFMQRNMDNLVANDGQKHTTDFNAYVEGIKSATNLGKKQYINITFLTMPLLASFVSITPCSSNTSLQLCG
jgi:hypothetical protein